MKTSFVRFGLFFLFSFAAFSCNKDDGSNTPTPDPDPVPTEDYADCRITAYQSVRDGVTANGTLSYTLDLKLREHTETGTDTSKKNFAYFVDFIIGFQVVGSFVSHSDSIFLNSDEYVTRFRSVYPGSGVTTTVFTYGANNKIASATYTDFNGSTSARTYEHNAAGDLTKITSGSTATTFDYYTDKPIRAGDALQLEAMLSFGSGQVFSNAHLVKSQTTNGSVTSYAYEFDGLGRITELTITPPSGSATTLTFTQKCD